MDDERERWRLLAHRAVLQARTRYDEHWDRRDDVGTLIALVEVLVWLDLLAEQEKLSGEDKELLDGLGWARDRGVHAAAELHQLREGASWPWRFPVRFQEYRWRARQDVGEAPPHIAKKARYQAKGAAFERLAGRPVHQTLDEAMTALAVLARSAGRSQGR